MATRVEASLHLRISGRVQGVGFRWSMAQAATRLGLRGWVRNRRDGSVEAVAVGDAAALAALRDWIQGGPLHAGVEQVAQREPSQAEAELAGPGFARLPTC